MQSVLDTTQDLTSPASPVSGAAGIRWRMVAKSPSPAHGRSPRCSIHLRLAGSALRVPARTRGLAFDALWIPAGRGIRPGAERGASVENEKHPWMTSPRWYPPREKRAVGSVRPPGTDRPWGRPGSVITHAAGPKRKTSSARPLRACLPARRGHRGAPECNEGWAG